MSTTANILRDNLADIMEIWQKEVIVAIPASREANAIALYDHLPNLVNDIADIIERHNKTEDLIEDKRYEEILVNSKHHGRHRATTQNYTVEQVVHEYIIFHRTITDFLKAKNGYDENVSDLLKYVIETSILKSVGSFSRSIQEMQEKLIGTLAHDIRNPLTVANLSLEMIEYEEDEEWVGKMLQAAKRSVKKATSLIEGLMNGITVRAGEGMMFDFEDRDVLDDIKWVHEEAKEVYLNEINLEHPDTFVRGVFDGTAIRRLLENLIGNAVKYGSPKHPIKITIKDKKEKIEIAVHNHGNPISAENQKHIFGFLERKNPDSDTVGKSWGMGLTLVQIVAEAHGGDIKLISNEETGTSFTVTLLKNFNRPGKKRTKLKFVEKGK